MKAVSWLSLPWFQRAVVDELVVELCVTVLIWLLLLPDSISGWCFGPLGKNAHNAKRATTARIKPPRPSHLFFIPIASLALFLIRGYW